MRTPTVQELRTFIVKLFLSAVHDETPFYKIQYSKHETLDDYLEYNSSSYFLSGALIAFDSNKIALENGHHNIEINYDKDMLFNLMLVLSKDDYEKLMVASELKSIEPSFKGVLFCNYESIKNYALKKWHNENE